MRTSSLEARHWTGVIRSLSSPVVRRLSVHLDFCIITNPHCLIGASGVGELLANTLAVRNVTVVVLDVKPIVTENCKGDLVNCPRGD